MVQYLKDKVLYNDAFGRRYSIKISGTTNNPRIKKNQLLHFEILYHLYMPSGMPLMKQLPR